MRATPSPRLSVATFAAAALLACATRAAAPAAAPRLEGFGHLEWRVTTGDAAAQELFQRGLLQLYAFNRVEAARAFRAALGRDARCAMCAWGVAMALGPNINAVERGDLSEARRYAALARDRARDGTPLERMLTEAVVERYGEDGDGKTAPPEAPICTTGGGDAPHPLDVRYAALMQAAADAFPEQPDVTSLYAEARMIATRVDWWDPRTGEPAPGIADLARRLERALAKAPTHTGLNHYLIHAVDAPRVASRAEAAADRLGALAPASPHLLHMPAHTYVRLGRWNDAVRVNVEALDADVRQERALRRQGYEPSPSWEGHNMRFLWYAALMDGRGELALAQARRLAQLSAQRENATGEFMRALPMFTLARLERWSEVLAAPMPSSRTGIATAIAHQARGLALARLGRTDDARAEASALETTIESTALDGEKIFGADPAREVLAVLRARLDAELLASQGRVDAALHALDQAVEREYALESAEPPLLGAGSELARGDLAASRGRWSDAEASYRDDLAEHPNSGWAWSGLARALAAQGRASDAAHAREAGQRAWASADDRLRADRMQ
jgi:tetratricopeptide (TPR) repeat protein